MARKSRRILAIAATAAAALALVPGSASASRCKGAYLNPASASAGSIEQATRCLVNAARRRRGRRPLRRNRRLSLAATRHARDMALNNYFSHDSRDGSSFLDRIRRVHYLPHYGAWSAGENLAWGSGDYATPKSIVRSWMHSPGHRANILDSSYREIGIGVVFGAPVGGVSNAATYASEFGARR
jgi:uncharacterized protein YkwD